VTGACAATSTDPDPRASRLPSCCTEKPLRGASLRGERVALLASQQTGSLVVYLHRACGAEGQERGASASAATYGPASLGNGRALSRSSKTSQKRRGLWKRAVDADWLF
jgi:hypothetical protein